MRDDLPDLESVCAFKAAYDDVEKMVADTFGYFIARGAAKEQAGRLVVVLMTASTMAFLRALERQNIETSGAETDFYSLEKYYKIKKNSTPT